MFLVLLRCSSTVFFFVIRCSSGYLWLSCFLQCSSGFFFALRCSSRFFVVLWGFSVFGFLQVSGLLMVPQRSFLFYGVIRGSSLFYGVFRDSSGFLAVLRCISRFLVILRCSSGFLVVLLCFSVFLVVLRSSSGFPIVLGFLRVAKLFCGVTRRSGSLPRQIL